MKFKAGDKVKVKRFEKRPSGWNIEGCMDHLMGKIVEIREVTAQSIIIYDELYRRRWYLKKSEIEPVNETIVIYRKGNETIALDKRTGKKAVAKCCPEDTFDFNTGARLAFDRLTESEKKPLNAKIVFTKGDDVFKTGHIYEIKNGKLKRPDTAEMLPGYDCVGFDMFYSIEEVKDYFTKFSERKLHKHGWSCCTLEFIEVKND